MLGKCFGIICSVSVIFALFCGRTKELCSAIISGASKSVTLTISLIGIMALWNGIMSVLKDCGAISKLAKIMKPVLKFVFPSSFKNDVATEEITSCISANLLGMANATTPLAIKAIEKMYEGNSKEAIREKDGEKAEKNLKLKADAERDKEKKIKRRKSDDRNECTVASADMITLAILGCASFNLIPSTVIAMRQAMGATITYQIIFPVWICSAGCALLGIVLSRIFAKIYGKN